MKVALAALGVPPAQRLKSCSCPARPGEDCPLTLDECEARTRDYVGMPWFGERLQHIYEGFVRESANGVVCSIPDTGLNTPPHRTWCARCQRRYMELKSLSEMLVGVPPTAPPTPAVIVRGDGRKEVHSSEIADDPAAYEGYWMRAESAPPAAAEWQPFDGKVFGLWETNMKGESSLEGIALTHEDATAWVSAWFPQGCSRTSLSYNIVKLPAPPVAANSENA